MNRATLSTSAVAGDDDLSVSLYQKQAKVYPHAVCVAFAASLWLRAGFSVNVIRDRGTLARIVEDGRVENVYGLKIMNRTEQRQQYRIAVSGLPGLAIATDPVASVDANAIGALTVRLTLPPDQAKALAAGVHAIEFAVSAAGDASGTAPPLREASTFFVPR